MPARAITDRISLEPLAPRHAAGLYRAIDASREHLKPWLAWVDRTKCVEDVLAFAHSALARHEDGSAVRAAIVYDRQPAGCICLEDIDAVHRSAEIGYWLGKGFEGHGLVTLSARALLEHAFGKLELNRIQLRVSPENERSRAVARRLGFTYEGTFRQVARIYDRFEDLECYSMLRDEWVAGKGQA